MTTEDAVKTIGVAGMGKVSTVELTTAVNVNNNGVSKVSYSARAWRNGGPLPYPMASGYVVDDIVVSMVKAIEKYSHPVEDKARRIAELEKEIIALKTL